MATGVIATEKAHGIGPLPLTGQDATAQGLQYIISGWQSMTVWKDTRKLANIAAKEAIALLNGKSLTTTGSVPNGSKKEPAYIIPPVMLNKSNWTQIYKSGYIKKSVVCNGAYAKYCK
jgi:ABC-type xylose transport system substrate-binding protein